VRGQGDIIYNTFIITAVETSNHISGTSVGRQNCNVYISLTKQFNPEDGGSMASETLAFNYYTTWGNKQKTTTFSFSVCSTHTHTCLHNFLVHLFLIFGRFVCNLQGYITFTADTCISSSHHFVSMQVSLQLRIPTITSCTISVHISCL
jgi:hypothetical protein